MSTEGVIYCYSEVQDSQPCQAKTPVRDTMTGNAEH